MRYGEWRLERDRLIQLEALEEGRVRGEEGAVAEEGVAFGFLGGVERRTAKD